MPSMTKQAIRKADQFHDTTLLLRTAKLIADGTEHLCILRRVSGTGVTVQLFQSRPKATTFAIEMINGTQCPLEPDYWVGAYEAFRIPKDIDPRALRDMLEANDHRHEIRLNQALEGKLSVDGKAHAIKFTNISQQGACIACDNQLKLDQLVKIETKTLPDIPAKVRWRQNGRYGLIFEQTFRFDELARRLAPDSWPSSPGNASVH